MMKLSLPGVEPDLQPHIVVFGVGGAGGNAVNNMIQADLEGVEFVVANTDAQALQGSLAQRRLQLGTPSPAGWGPEHAPTSAAPPPRSKFPTSSVTCRAPTWRSSRPAWAAAPGPGPRR